MRRLFVVVSAFLLVVGLISCGGGRDETGPAASGQGISRPLDKGTITMRVFEGSTESQTPPAKTVTSSFLQYNLMATVASDEDPEAQSRRIGNAFNLASVTLLAESLLVWEKGKPEPGFQIFGIENKTYHVLVTLKDPVQRMFKIDVYEQNDGTRISLLSTEAGLPRDISTVFGFKNVQGKPYFVSLQIGEWSPAAGGGTMMTPLSPPPASPVPSEGPVAATGDIKPPKLVKRVDPVYPDEARKAGIEGLVILGATTDASGRVASVKVLRSVPELDQAAIDAIRQWVYKPLLIEGKPRGCTFTVTVRFSLKDKPSAPLVSAEEPVKTEEADLSDKAFEEGSALPPVRAADGIAPPTLVKRVDPVYPDDAHKAGIEGTVILEATTDASGRVASVKVLRSVPELDQAAIDAIRQWVYKPLLIDGKPRACIFTVTVRFKMH
jgi:TonB family protein